MAKKYDFTEGCGYTRGMYDPFESGQFIIKLHDGSYAIAYFDGDYWRHDSVSMIVCWHPLPVTAINIPF